MEYTIYKLQFLSGVHFGTNSLESTQNTFAADTLFSALCMEAMKKGSQYLEKLIQYVEKEQLLFSDAFPYMQDVLFLPKPMLYIENKAKGDSTVKKAYKKLQFVPVDSLDEYVKGSLDIEKMDALDLGHALVKTSASVRTETAETEPYRVGIYYFKDDCGLYIIVGYEEKEAIEYFEELMEGLSFSGIGGKKNSGLGRFAYYRKAVPPLLLERLGCKQGKLMTLSVSLTTEQELETVLEDASYLLLKRSGFVASASYAPQYLRKRDLYVFQAGSCFQKGFHGAIYDVSEGGSHPVYRYAKPLFMEVMP